MTAFRIFLIFLLLALSGPLAAANEEDKAILGEDGLWMESWALQSFLVLGEDRDDAALEGKRLMVIWEQRGCPYCTMLHQVNFTDPEIRTFLKANFALLQLNKYGALEVTDFDGEALEERELARKYRVLFTPTIQFFAISADEVQDPGPRAQEIARMPGYLPPEQFLAFLRYVEDGSFGKMSFADYLGPDTAPEIVGTPN
jgi:thioredoxin-related protein